MVTVFGDESSSSKDATYGLLAIADDQLPALNQTIASAKARLGAAGCREPLHSKVLFHDGPRSKSAFKNASRKRVEEVCATAIWEIARLGAAFFFGRVDRVRAPKLLHVAMQDPSQPNQVMYARMKLELPHLQLFAYGAAAVPACHSLQPQPQRVLLDQNRSVVQWFNQNRQAGRLPETFWMDAAMPRWPAVEFGDDVEQPGLQAVDMLTYYATRQVFDPRFAAALNPIRPHSQFIVYEFDQQVTRPYVAPPGVRVIELPNKERRK